MPKYKDNVTGQVIEFDHEPSQDELEQKFGLPRGSGSPSFGGPHEETSGGVAPGLLGTAGALIGGKTPAGKIGAGIGAAAGTGIGDLYDMFTHGVGDRTPGSEAARLATVGGLTTGMEVALPPVLRGIGHIKDVMPKGMGIGGGGLLGYLFGHPAAGIAAGAALEAAPKVAAGIDYLGAPAGTSAGTEASKQFLDTMSPSSVNRPEIQSKARGIGDMARKDAAGPMGDVPDYLKQENWGSSLRSARNYVKDKSSAALDGLMGMFESAPKPPVAPPSPAEFAGRTPKSFADVAERQGVSGQYSTAQPDLSRTPDARWSADVSASPMKTPSLTQTSPTDAAMPWEEHAGRSAPRRTATGGSSFQAAEVGIHPDVYKATEQGPLSGLKAAVEPVGAPEPAVSSIPPTHDVGLQRWLESGGTPEGYERRLKDAHPFGPNTVGAAEAKQWLPQTIDDAEGMSLAEQDKWEAFKRANPGTSDSLLNSWYTSNKMGADPNANLDITGKVDKLLSLLNPRK